MSELRIARRRAVDMSPSAIAQRLAQLEQLFRLGLSLRRARRIGRSGSDVGRARSIEPGPR